MRVYLSVSLTPVSWKATPFWCSLVGLRGGRGACEMNLQSIFIMGSHKQKKSSQTNVKKRKQSAGESYESSDSGSETQQPTSPKLLNVPRFLIVKSQEEKRTMADLSPFVIEKCIQSIVGHPKTIKKLKSGDLLLEVDRQQQVENLLKTPRYLISKSKYHYTSLSILPKVSFAVQNYILAATRRSLII